MIPGQFSYHRPRSVAEAVDLLARFGDEARPLAGGHSLIPMMKLRMAAPAHLVDIAGIDALRTVAEDGDTLILGAGVTQAEVLGSALIARRLPILCEASRQIADPQIRYRGTVGGNVANGDPGNDLPALMLALDATYVIAAGSGERRIQARDFYQAAYFTSLGDGELLTSVRIPLPPSGHGYAYEKLKRKVGDYATAASAVLLTLDGDRVASCSIALTNVAATPLLAAEAASAVVGTTLDAEAVRRASAAAMAIADPAADGRGSADYRRHMAGVMTARALARAHDRARTGA